MDLSSPITFRSVSRLLYTHNPFYLLSALLVLFGLHKVLSADASLTSGWLLMGVLFGYTLLLVAAGYVIVRFGQVWEDARTILLVIVLLLVALSVVFDKIVLDDPTSGARFLLLGFAFSVVASETALLSLDIRLRAAYRIPYYLLLALLFAYPVGLGQLSVMGHKAAMAWGVYLFPVVSAAALLTLWPAARSKRENEPPSGTPWQWPWFPWTLFVFLLIAISLRSYSLSMVFEATKGMAASFDMYFLSPLVLVTALLLLEMAIANNSRSAQGIALALPALALLMSLPGEHLNPVAARFLAMLSGTAGSPVQLALIGLGVFYAIAWLRGVDAGEFGLVACAVLFSMVDRHTVDVPPFTTIQPWPLVVAAVLELGIGAVRRSSWRVLVASICGVVALGPQDWSPTLPTRPTYVLLHGGALLVLLIAAVYNDRWAQLFRRFMALVIPAAALAAATAYEFVFPEIPHSDHACYLLGLCLVTALYWRRLPQVPELSALLVSLGSLFILGGRAAYLALKLSPLEKGLPWLAGGLAAFALAILVSFVKGGLIVRGWRVLRALNKA